MILAASSAAVFPVKRLSCVVFPINRFLSCELLVQCAVQAWKGVAFISELLGLVFQLSCFTSALCAL